MSYYQMVNTIEDPIVPYKCLRDEVNPYKSIENIMTIALANDVSMRELIDEIPILYLVQEYLETVHGRCVTIFGPEEMEIHDDGEDLKFFKPRRSKMVDKGPHNYIVRNNCKFIDPEYPKYGPFNFVRVHNKLSYPQTYNWFKDKYVHIRIFSHLKSTEYARRHNY